jgi:hypothetical protein
MFIPHTILLFSLEDELMHIICCGCGVVWDLFAQVDAPQSCVQISVSFQDFLSNAVENSNAVNLSWTLPLVPGNYRVITRKEGSDGNMALPR